MERYDVIVLGGGPAGLAAALSADKAGARTLLIEREARLGGVLKQCIHDGFGVVRFGKKMAGCEYAAVFLREMESSGVTVRTLTFCTAAVQQDGGYALTLVSRDGVCEVFCRALVLATGCRERTARQVQLHGTRPAGVLTAGAAQYMVNILGQLPGKRCVILGSGDIGLIMARRLTLEGAQVCGVYEAKSAPGGLRRNIVQCLDDFDIPLHLSMTVTRTFGRERLTAVETASVDADLRPIPGTERVIDCDTLILSVGLIPENELAESLDVPLDPRTKGAVCDQRYMTLRDGVFCCGNALHVNDLADYVTESGEDAGRAAAQYAGKARTLIPLDADARFLYAVPQRVDVADAKDNFGLFFRTREPQGNTNVRLLLDGRELLKRPYRALRPSEMERITVRLPQDALTPESRLTLVMEDA